MAEELGTALVEIQAPLDRLKADLAKIEAYVRKELDDGAELKIDADARAALAKIDGVSTEVGDIPDGDVTIDGDAAAALAAVDSIESGLAGIQDETVAIMGDPGDALGAVGEVGAGLAGLGDESVLVTADAGQALGNIQTVEASLAGIDNQEVRVSASTGEAQSDIQSVEAALATIENQEVRITADTGEAQAEVRSLDAALVGLEDQTVQVTAQTSGMGASLGAAAGQSGMLGGAIGGVAGKVGMLKAGVVGLAGGATLGAFHKLGMASLNLSDTVNGTNVIFREAAGTILDFGSTSANALGVSKQSALEYSNSLGTLLQGLGYSAKDAADVTVEAFTRANDVSSATGKSRQQVIEAMISAYAGEREAIKSIIGAITEEEVSQRVLSMGLAGTTKEITAQDKAMATHAIIMEKSAMFAGDFARTQDEGLNIVARATTAVLDQAAALGGAFAPAIEDASGAVLNLTESVGPLIEGLALVGGKVGPLVGDLLGVIAQGAKGAVGPLGLVTGALELIGVGADDAMPPVRDLTAEQYNLAESLRTGRPLADDLASGIEGVGGAASNARLPVEDMATALERIIGVSLGSEQAHLRWEESLLRVRASLEENGHHLDGNSEKQLKLKGDVLAAAQATLGYAGAMEEEGVAHGKVNAYLATARQRLIDTMVAGGMTRAEAERYIFTLGLTKENLDRVANSTDTAKHRTDAMRGMIETTSGAVIASTGFWGGYRFGLDDTSAASTHAKGRTDELKGSLDRSAGAASTARDRFFGFEGAVRAVPGSKEVHVRTPGLHEAHVSLDAFKGQDRRPQGRTGQLQPEAHTGASCPRRWPRRPGRRRGARSRPGPEGDGGHPRPSGDEYLPIAGSERPGRWCGEQLPHGPPQPGRRRRRADALARHAGRPPAQHGRLARGSDLAGAWPLRPRPRGPRRRPHHPVRAGATAA